MQPVDELERAVTKLGFKGALVSGATEGRYLDHPSFDPLLRRAETLDVPNYLHPAPSPKPARDALYGGLPDDFSRRPGLKIMIGHLGEGLQVMMPSLDQQFHQLAGFAGLPSQILRKHVWVSTDGFFFLPSFMAALDAFGSDRLLYSLDYPLGSLEGGRAFLEQLPVDPSTLAKITHQNADQLLKLSG